MHNFGYNKYVKEQFSRYDFVMGDTKLSSQQRWEKVWQSLWCYLTTCSEHESSQSEFQDPQMEVQYQKKLCPEIPLQPYIDFR